MTDYILSEFYDNLNEIINQPIQLTQRIKYTCCDISKEYIVFGASSGGLYIFHRNPCSFDKLIPSTEGSIVQISISPDEKLLAFATSKGTICLVEINSKNLDFQLYNEHSGNIITAMRWTGINNEIFAGDNSGKMSIITYTNFITKTMFQNLCSPILQLESKIVQIDTCNNFLLVSTLTRCYLFDTFREQYRQIGQKLRDGEYGACFFGKNLNVTNNINQDKPKGVFKILGEKESFNTNIELSNLKIFCSRPGLRLWEVDINGFVLRTHQFKNAIKDPSEVIKITNEDQPLETLPNEQVKPNLTQINFTKLYFFNSNFLISYKNDSIFILDPCNGKIILWTNKYKDISDIKVVNNRIYVITQKFKIIIHHLLFSNVENFAIKSYINKKYYFCASFLVKNLDKLIKIAPQSQKLHILHDLEEKLKIKMADDFEVRAYFNKLKQLFDILNSENLKPLSKKLENGIFVVDNAHFVENSVEKNNSEASTSVVEKPAKFEYLYNDHIKRIFEQYELFTIIGNQNTKVLSDILNNFNNDEIFKFFEYLELYGSEKNIKMADFLKWCHEQLLNFIYTEKDYVLLIFNLNLEENLGLLLKESFENVNSANTVFSCSCNYPLPQASRKPPTFFRIGCFLLEKFLEDHSKLLDFCKKVPYMWKQVIISQNSNLTSILPILIQFSDITLLESFLSKFTYDHWLEALKLYILLSNGKCLSCESGISTENMLSWNVFATLMLKSIGAESTVELLLQNADKIPSSALESKFYQSLIFNSMACHFQNGLRVKSVDFVEKISESSQNEFEKLLEKTLQNPSTNYNFNSQVKVEENCCSCEMPLQTPIINKEIPIFLQCGHKFHNICYKNQKNICNICTLN